MHLSAGRERQRRDGRAVARGSEVLGRVKEGNKDGSEVAEWEDMSGGLRRNG